MRELNVLLTGFVPGEGFRPNPSYEAIKHLDNCVLTNAALGMRLIVSARELENAYALLLDQIPQLYGLREGPDVSEAISCRLAEHRWHICLHFGGDDTRDLVSFEHDTQRWGYDLNEYPTGGSDHACAGAPMDRGRRGVVGQDWDGLGEGEEELLSANIDVDKVVDALKADFARVDAFTTTVRHIATLAESTQRVLLVPSPTGSPSAARSESSGPSDDMRRSLASFTCL